MLLATPLGLETYEALTNGYQVFTSTPFIVKMSIYLIILIVVAICYELQRKHDGGHSKTVAVGICRGYLHTSLFLIFEIYSVVAIVHHKLNP